MCANLASVPSTDIVRDLAVVLRAAESSCSQEALMFIRRPVTAGFAVPAFGRSTWLRGCRRSDGGIDGRYIGYWLRVRDLRRGCSRDYGDEIEGWVVREEEGEMRVHVHWQGCLRDMYGRGHCGGESRVRRMKGVWRLEMRAGQRRLW